MRSLLHSNALRALGAHILLFVALFVTGSIGASAQSADLDSPTPIQSSQISGTIVPLDIGDPRLTRHFYLFTGTQGDLTLTVSTSELNGDIDIFTANGMRPLMKVSLYASGSVSNVRKTVFLHQTEPLILRVEARVAGDNPGNYKIQFGGAFRPIEGLATSSENESKPPAVATGKQTGRRLSSVGATIEEPITPKAEATAKPPAPVSEEESPSEPRTSTRTPSAVARTSPGVSTPRNSSQRPPPRTARRGARPRPTPPTAPRASSTPSATTVPVQPAPQQQIPAPPSSRLVVELKDGTRIERAMSSVRRVTIDNNQVVIINNNGRIERIPLTNLSRMAIEPPQ
jgi:hypothetical protein